MVALFAWLMVFVVGSQSGLGNISTKNIIFLVLSGLATGGSWLCYFKALQLGDVNKVVPIDKSSTVLTMLLAFIFLGENLTLLKILCMALIAVGTLLMIERKDADSQQQGTNRRWLLYAVFSALFASLTAILGKVGVTGVESNLATALRTMVVLVLAWLMVLFTKKQSGIKNIDGKSWVFLVLSGLATGGSWLCYYKALQDGPASVVVPIDKLSILVTVLFARVIFREKLTAKAIVGLVLIVAGTLLLLL